MPAPLTPSAALESALQELDAMERGFNLFEATGLVGHEVRHSHFLAYMLNPRGKHGLGTAFTHAFIARLFGDRRTSGATAWQVRREWRHIDILLVDEERHRVFVIENKIEAGEHGDQLARYVKTAQQAYPNHARRFAFLSPDARKPSHAKYRAVGYDAVRDAFDDVLKGAACDPRVRTAIEDYLELLRRYVLPGTDEASVCRRIWREHETELSALMACGEGHHPESNDEAADAGPAANHPVAWAMLSANRPDTRQRIRDLAVALRSELVDAGAATTGYTSSVYVVFRPLAWTDEFARLRARGWSRAAEYPLYVELHIGHDALWLDVWLAGSALPALRAACFAWAESRRDLFPALPAKLNRSSISLHHEVLLSADDAHSSWSSVEAAARERFHAFVSAKLPLIVAASVDIQWPAES